MTTTKLIPERKLCLGLQTIGNLSDENNFIHVDWSDVASLLKDAGSAWLGVGFASGEEPATTAAERACEDAFADVADVDAAVRSACISIAGPASGLPLSEAAQAVEIIHKRINPDANIIWSLELDDDRDEIQVTLFGFGD